MLALNYPNASLVILYFPCWLSSVPASIDFWCSIQSSWKESAGGKGEEISHVTVNQ